MPRAVGGRKNHVELQLLPRGVVGTAAWSESTGVARPSKINQRIYLLQFEDVDSIELPPPIEEMLRSKLGDLSAVATEALLVELYRQGHLSHAELARSLGASRYETDGVLKRHGVTEDYLTSAELKAQVEGLRKLIGP